MAARRTSVRLRDVTAVRLNAKLGMQGCLCAYQLSTAVFEDEGSGKQYRRHNTSNPPGWYPGVNMAPPQKWPRDCENRYCDQMSARVLVAEGNWRSAMRAAQGGRGVLTPGQLRGAKDKFLRLDGLLTPRTYKRHRWQA